MSVIPSGLMSSGEVLIVPLPTPMYCPTGVAWYVLINPDGKSVNEIAPCVAATPMSCAPSPGAT